MEVDRLSSTVMLPFVVTMTFDLSIQKPNHHSSRPWYICDIILVKLAPIVTKIMYLPGFLGHCLLWP